MGTLILNLCGYGILIGAIVVGHVKKTDPLTLLRNGAVAAARWAGGKIKRGWKGFIARFDGGSKP